MIRIIDRYLGKQILIGTCFSVFVLTLVFGLGNIFKRALPRLVDDELSTERFLQFVVHILPFAIAFTIPWGFLTAILLTFGKLSANNELTALRMAGVSILRICAPVLVIAFALSGLCFWLNLSISPQSKGEMKRILNEVVRDDPTILFRESGGIEGRMIYGERVNKNLLKNVRIVQLDDKKGQTPVMWLFANTMQITPNSEADLQLELESVQLEVRDQEEPRNSLKTQYGISMDNLPQELSLDKLKRKNLKPNEKTYVEIQSLLRDNSLPADELAEHRTELTRRYSLSFACVAFCLVGIPLGITAHRRETSIGFALSLGVAITYFVFILGAEMIGDREGILPRILMWSPNVIFISLGLFLFYRVNRH